MDRMHEVECITCGQGRQINVSKTNGGSTRRPIPPLRIMVQYYSCHLPPHLHISLTQTCNSNSWFSFWQQCTYYIYILANIFSVKNKQITHLPLWKKYFILNLERISGNRPEKPSSLRLFNRLQEWATLGVKRCSWSIIIVTFFVGAHILFIFRLKIYRFIRIRIVLIFWYSVAYELFSWST